MINIEKDIPLPNKEWRKSRFADIVNRMTNGDSVYCDNKKDAITIAATLRYRRYKTVIRKEKDGARVWMVASIADERK